MNLHTTTIDKHSWARVSAEDKRSIEGLIRMGTWAAADCECVNTGSMGRASDIRCPATWSRLDNGEIDFNHDCQHLEVCGYLR